MFIRRLSKRAAAFLVALMSVQLAAAASAALSVRQDGDEIIVNATAEVAADEATTWDVLTGYDRLPDFIPDMSASRTLERDESNALVMQSGHASLGPFKQDFSVTLAVHEVRGQSVTARAVAGDFRRFESSYLLRSNGAGRTQIEYSAVIEPKDGILPLIGLPLMRGAIRVQFEALLVEINRCAQAPAACNAHRLPVLGDF